MIGRTRREEARMVKEIDLVEKLLETWKAK